MIAVRGRRRPLLAFATATVLLVGCVFASRESAQIADQVRALDLREVVDVTYTERDAMADGSLTVTVAADTTEVEALSLFCSSIRPIIDDSEVTPDFAVLIRTPASLELASDRSVCSP